MTHDEEVQFWFFFQSYMQLGSQRRGQAMMNALARVAPELYDMVSQTHADCFYQDAKIGAFRDVLGI